MTEKTALLFVATLGMDADPRQGLQMEYNLCMMVRIVRLIEWLE